MTTKTAGLGAGLLEGAQQMGMGAVRTARNAGRAISGAGKVMAPFGRVLQRGAMTDPIGFGATAMVGVPFIGSLGNPLKSPEGIANKYQGRQLAAATMERPMKLASSVLSQEDLDASLRLVARFDQEPKVEKTAARREVAKDILEAAMGDMENAWLHGHGHIPASKASGGGGVRARMESMLGRGDNELHEVQLEKLKAEIEKFRSEGASRAGADLRAKEKHEHDMKAWTPRQLLSAGLAVGAAATGVGLGTQGLSHGLGVAHEKLREFGSNSRFNAVVKVDPTLAESPRAREYFGILDRASPYLAGEPLLAAAAVQQMLNTPATSGTDIPGVRPDLMQGILRTEKERQGVRFPILPQTQTDLRNVALLA